MPRLPAHQVTTRNLGAAYPFIAEAGLGRRGVVIGDDLLGGSFVFDPFELYAAGVVSNPNMVVFGQIGRGKSAFVKTFLWRQAVFGRRAWVVDPKGEYGDLADAWGVRPVSLRPGGAIRLNPLDPGPDADDDAAGPDASGRRRMELLSSLASACLGRALVPRERAALGAALAEATRAAAVPTVPVVVEALLTPTADAARSLRTEQRDLLEDGRDVALELRRLVYGDLRGMFDGPTTTGLDLSSPLVVLDLSALYSSAALGVLMACATAWLQAALARAAVGGDGTPSGRSRFFLVVDEAWAILSNLGVARSAAVVLEAVPGLRRLQRRCAPPGLGPALGRCVGLGAGGPGTGAAVGFGDPRRLRAVAGRARGGDRASLLVGHRDGSASTTPAGHRLVEGGTALVPGAAPPQRDRTIHGGHRRRHDGVTGLASLVLPLGLGGALVAGISQAGGTWGGRSRRKPSRGARWARRRDLRPLLVTANAPPPGRLLLGVCAGVARQTGLAAERAQSLVVVGPTQSGKTTSLAVPAILGWQGPVLAASVKSDLLRHTLGTRSRLGQVWCVDPTGCTGARVSTWSPLNGCRQWRDACRAAAALCEAAKGDGTSADAEFWYATAAKLLAPLFVAAALDRRSMADVVRWVDTQEVGEVAAILERSAPPEVLQAAEATWCRDERTRSSIYTTTETVLAPFAHPPPGPPPVSAFEPDHLLHGAHTLYLCAPAHDQRRLRGYFTALDTGRVVACVCPGHEGGPSARPATPGGTRRGSPHCPAARARRAGGNLRVARHTDRHGLAGPGPGQGPLWRTGAHGSQQPPGEALSARHRRPRHAGVRQPPHRRRGGVPPFGDA